MTNYPITSSKSLPLPIQIMECMLCFWSRDYSSCKGEYTPVFFEPGDFCMALFSEDGLWYRGVVEEGGEEEVSQFPCFYHLQ